MLTILYVYYCIVGLYNALVYKFMQYAFSALTLLIGRQEGYPAWWGAGVIICLWRGAHLHTVQLMPLPFTVCSFSKIQIDLPFWYRLIWVVPEKGPLNVCMCAVEVCLQNSAHINSLDFAVGSCFSEIFCVKSRETIAECMQLFNCQFVKHAADKRRHSFIQKYSASRNGLCESFT